MGDDPRALIRKAEQEYEAALAWWAEKCDREKARAEQAEQTRDLLAERVREIEKEMRAKAREAEDLRVQAMGKVEPGPSVAEPLADVYDLLLSLADQLDDALTTQAGRTEEE